MSNEEKRENLGTALCLLFIYKLILNKQKFGFIMKIQQKNRRKKFQNESRDEYFERGQSPEVTFLSKWLQILSAYHKLSTNIVQILYQWINKFPKNFPS